MAGEECLVCKCTVTAEMVAAAEKIATNEKSARDHARAHYGTRPGQAGRSLYQQEWTSYVFCTLHMLLRMYGVSSFVGMNVEVWWIMCVGALCSDAHTGTCSTEILCKWTLWEVISEPQAEKLVAFLKEKGVLFAEMTATFKKEHPEDAFRYGTARAIVPC